MIPQLQAITERVARHQRDHPVGPKTDTELIMAYIVTLHSRIEDLERRIANPHSATPTPHSDADFEVQTRADTRADYQAPSNIAFDTLMGEAEEPLASNEVSIIEGDVMYQIFNRPAAYKDAALQELRTQWIEENSIVGDEQ